MKHYRGLEVKFLPPTNTKGSRVKITDKRNHKSVTIPYDYRTDSLNTAVNYLAEKGFNIIGFIDMDDHYVVLCDNWGDDFLHIK